MSGFVFGSWNAGTNNRDYTLLFKDRDDAPKESFNFTSISKPEDQQMVKSIAQVRKKLLEETAKDLVHAADVYALQEVKSDDRPDIKVFQKNGFQIYRPQSKKPKDPADTRASDTAIAINPAKFSNIKNKSFTTSGGLDFAVVTCIEKSTGKKIAFVSGHIPGFNLEEKDQSIMRDGAETGDNEIRAVIDRIQDICADCDSVMFGADMNANPEIYNPRFQLLIDAGFEVHRTNSPTNNMERNTFNPERKVHLKERELDYIFIKKQEPSGFFHALKKLFNRDTIQVAHIDKSRSNLTLDPISSPSDHIPIFIRVEEVANSPKGFLGSFVDKIFSWFK